MSCLISILSLTTTRIASSKLIPAFIFSFISSWRKSSIFLLFMVKPLKSLVSSIFLEGTDLSATCSVKYHPSADSIILFSFSTLLVDAACCFHTGLLFSSLTIILVAGIAIISVVFSVNGT